MPAFVLHGQRGSPSAEKTVVPTLKHLIAQLLGDGTSDSRSKAALALQYLSLNSDNAMAILDHPDALKALRFVLMNGSQDDREYAAGAIAHLAVNEEAEHIIATTDGILPALVALLRFGTEKGKQQAAAALENLSVSNGLTVCRQDGVIEGLTQLVLNTQDSKGMETAAAVLQNLALIPECRRNLQTPPLFRGLVNILLFGSSKAKEDSAAAIGNLAASEEIVDEAMHTPSLLDGLVELLLNGSDRGKSDAATAIGNLSIRDDMRSMILEHPGLLSGLDSMLNSLSERHKGEAALCVQNLSICSIPQKIRIARFGRIVDGLVNLVSRPNLHSQYQEDASSALLNLLVGCSENKKSAIRIPNFMSGTIYCMRYGSDRSQENATAILQNLAFNDHEIRLFIIGYPEALKFLGELILIGSHKTQEHALAAVASIARSKQGAVAMLDVRGMLESLVMMTQSSVLSIQTFAASALQAFSQFKQTADTLIRNLVATRAFLPLLQGDGRNEQTTRIHFLAATGLSSICAFDSKIIDIIPDNVKSVLAGAIRVSMQKPNTATSNAPSLDLLRNLQVVCHKENARSFVAASLSQLLVRFLKEADLSLDIPGEAVVETIKLCWQLSFDNDSKALLLASGIFDALSAFQLPRYAEINEIQFWASGAMLQFQLLDLKQFSMSLHKNAHDKLAKENGGFNRSFFIVYDPADRYIVEKIVSIVESCGHSNKTQLYSHSDTQWHSMDLISFASALSENSWIFVAMSNKSELDPYCRFKMEQAVLNGNQVVPLNVEPGYEPHGHFGTWPAVLECTENVLEGGRSSVLLDLLRSLKENARLQPTATSQPIERVLTQEGSEVPEKLQDTTEIALTLAFEYGEINNIEDFCAQVRMDVAAAANLRRDRVRVLKVVAGRAATLDLSSLDAAIDLHAFTTLTLAVRGDVSRSPIDIARGLKMQVNEAASKLRCGILTSTTLDILFHVPQTDDAMTNNWQNSPQKSNSVRNSSCSPFDLESISSVTRSNSAANVSTSIVLDKAPPVCDASTQSDSCDFPSNLSALKGASNAAQSKESFLSVHNESAASLPTSGSDLLDVNEDIARSRQPKPTSQMQAEFVEPIHSIRDSDLPMPLSHNGEVEMVRPSPNGEVQLIQRKLNSAETDTFGFDGGSKHELLDASIRSNGNLTTSRMEAEAVGTGDSAHIDNNGACLNLNLEGSIEGSSAIADNIGVRAANKSILQHEIASIVSENGIRQVSDGPANLRQSRFAQSQAVDRFYEYQPDLQLHLLVRKQDLMIESLQRKLELLQMELQLYQDGTRQTRCTSRTVFAAHSTNPHLAANLHCDAKLASSRETETESRGMECKILDQNMGEETSLFPERVSMESKATECDIITSDNQNPSLFPLKEMESKSTECNIESDLICSNQSSSVYVQTIPIVQHRPLTESKGTDCRLLVDKSTVNLADSPRSPILSRPAQHEKLNANVCSWAESLAGTDKKGNEVGLVDSLNGIVSEMLEKIESAMAIKLNAGIQNIANRGVSQRIGAENISKIENLVFQSPCKLGQSARSIQVLAEDRETANQATDHESLKNKLLLQSLAKITSDMLVRFESTLDSRLKECVENLREQTANNNEKSADSLVHQVSQERVLSSTKATAIKSVEHDKEQMCSVRGASQCHEIQNDCLYGLYHSLESGTSHFTDTVSLSPTRPSTPLHISCSTHAQPASSIRNIVQLPNKERITLPDVSRSTAVGKIIAQYLPEYQEGIERFEPPANVAQPSVQRVHRPRFQRKSPTLSLSLIGPGNVCSDSSSPSQPPSTPRGISFRQLPRPKAKRAIISTLYSVDLDVLASQSKTSFAESDSWLLGSSCSSVNSFDTHTSASTLSLWASSPAMYKRSLTKDIVRQVADCPPVELDTCNTGPYVHINDSMSLL